jgi:hypothetical protein
MYIQSDGYTWYIPGYTMYMPCICRTSTYTSRRGIYQAYSRHIPKIGVPDVFEETPLASTGLKLQQVPMEELLLAQRDTDNTEADLENVDLGKWLPDFILVSWKRKRIAVVDLTRPSDMLSAQLAEAYCSKKRKYGPV